MLLKIIGMTGLSIVLLLAGAYAWLKENECLVLLHPQARCTGSGDFYQGEELAHNLPRRQNVRTKCLEKRFVNHAP